MTLPLALYGKLIGDGPEQAIPSDFALHRGSCSEPVFRVLCGQEAAVKAMLAASMDDRCLQRQIVWRVGDGWAYAAPRGASPDRRGGLQFPIVLLTDAQMREIEYQPWRLLAQLPERIGKREDLQPIAFPNEEAIREIVGPEANVAETIVATIQAGQGVAWGLDDGFLRSAVSGRITVGKALRELDVRRVALNLGEQVVMRDLDQVYSARTSSVSASHAQRQGAPQPNDRSNPWPPGATPVALALFLSGVLLGALIGGCTMAGDSPATVQANRDLSRTVAELEYQNNELDNQVKYFRRINVTLSQKADRLSRELDATKEQRNAFAKHNKELEEQAWVAVAKSFVSAATNLLDTVASYLKDCGTNSPDEVNEGRSSEGSAPVSN